MVQWEQSYLHLHKTDYILAIHNLNISDERPFPMGPQAKQMSWLGAYLLMYPPAQMDLKFQSTSDLLKKKKYIDSLKGKHYNWCIYFVPSISTSTIIFYNSLQNWVMMKFIDVLLLLTWICSCNYCVA